METDRHNTAGQESQGEQQAQHYKIGFMVTQFLTRACLQLVTHYALVHALFRATY